MTLRDKTSLSQMNRENEFFAGLPEGRSEATGPAAPCSLLMRFLCTRPLPLSTSVLPLWLFEGSG